MNFSEFIENIKIWGEKTGHVKAIVLIGSYARGTFTAASDIDLVILTTAKSELIADPEVFIQFGVPEKINIEYYGAVTSVRIWYRNGFEVEYGIAETSWIGKPLDPGTRKCLRGGYKVIVDKCGFFKDMPE